MVITVTFQELEVQVETVYFIVVTSLEEFLLAKSVCEKAENHEIFFLWHMSSH